MRIARVFPRRTNATPDDELAFVGTPGLFPPEVDRVHISVTFEWDLPEAARLAREWTPIAPVEVGGPATGIAGGEFEPGMYLRSGYVITSRGCPNRCWFCKVWRREGPVRQLRIKDGWNVLDDNVLACSEEHVRAVFQMLRRQDHRPRFTGGLEAARFKPWMAEELRILRPETAYFAYDTEDDWEPLVEAARMLRAAGVSLAGHSIRAYVLCGYPKDRLDAAEGRMRAVAGLGLMPMAMLWRVGLKPGVDPRWVTFQRRWARPHIVGTLMKEMK